MAEELKHAEGPWTASFSFHGREPGIGDVWQIDCENHAICTTQFCYAPNTEANARLIATAPDGLELALMIINSVDGACLVERDHPQADMADILRAAFDLRAKATGSPQQGEEK